MSENRIYQNRIGGIAQGIEFTPEGDKLFVGSGCANRIEVFDVAGEYELRKNPKFLKTGHGHCNNVNLRCRGEMKYVQSVARQIRCGCPSNGPFTPPRS